MKYYLICLFAIISTALFAQEEKHSSLSLWLTESMADGEVVGQGDSIDLARAEAFGQLYDRQIVSIDSTSLLATLQAEDSSFAVDRRKAWIEAAMIHETWVKEDTLCPDSSTCWVRLKATQEEIDQFEEQLLSTCLRRGSEYLTRAHFCYERGDILAAAQEYAKGLSQMVPCIHRSLASDNLVGEDLAQYLYTQYLNVFKNLRISSLYEQIPVVMGEEIPINLKFRVTVDNKPVVNLPIQGWITNGRMKVDERTDSEGFVTMHIVQAPTKEGERAGIIIHSNLSAMLEDNFARPAQASFLSSITEDASTQLVPFDPTPTFYLSLDSLDLAQHDSLAVMLTRQGMVEVSDSASADIVFNVNYQDERGYPIKRGNYMLSSTKAQLSLQVVERQTAHPLVSYAVPELSFAHPESRSAVEVRHRTMELMMRQVSDEMPPLMKYVKYDKRKVVYDSVVK